ncbi:hypothetical protein V492_07715 [Pseudogymnoascus sp. VKM F-4246]|nr:hypothetical protein V492_07715 [Pseudogymnoascus sp. VKM F-4246]
MATTNAGDVWSKYGKAPSRKRPRHHSSTRHVLDLGCGVGELTNAGIASHGSELPPYSRLIASDIAAGMIEQLKVRKSNELSKGTTAWSKIETSVDDARDLSAFADSSVSHLLAGFVLFMVPQPRTALKEIRRVLTDENGGGAFAMSSWLELDSEWYHIMTLTNQFRPERPSVKMPQEWLTIDGIRGELQEAGFRDVDVYPLKTYLPFEGYEELADFMMYTFPNMDRMTAGFSEEELGELRRQIIEYVKSRHPTAPSKLEGTAIIAVCRK